MEIKQSEKTELIPFLDQIFKQQHEKQFRDHLPEEESQVLAFGAWNHDELVGGIVGKRQYDTLHISLLGVDETCQKAGVGSALIQAIEKQAIRDEVKTITLTTKSYQALGFYLKKGYKIFGELEDVPMVGTTKYYLVKRIESKHLENK